MNLFERAGIQQAPPWKKAYFTRLERIKQEGSEPFNWEPGAIAAGVISIITVEAQFPRARKYIPLNYIEISNNDVVDVELQINTNERWYVPAGGFRWVRGAIHQIGVLNLDAAAATTAGKIKVSVQRECETIDDWARRQK